MFALFRTLLPAAGLFLCLAPAARADVLILEAPELGAFADPQMAVDQAPEGATLVFGQEPLPGFVIDGKSLTLITSRPKGINVQGTLVIQGLAAGQTVRLQDVWVRGADSDSSTFPTLESEPGMRILDSEGSVRLSGCRIEGGAGIYDFDSEEYPDGSTALIVESSADVALLDTEIFGGVGGGFLNSVCCTGGTGGSGLEALGSTLALYSCRLLGGAGGEAGFNGGDAGDACRTVESHFFASGCEFQGGLGGSSVDFLVSFGGDGGDGLSAQGLPRPRLLDSSFVAGGAGFGLDGNGAVGEERTWDFGALPMFPGPHRGLRVVEPLVLSGTDLSLDLEGVIGDRFFITASLRDARTRKFQPQGILLFPTPAVFPTMPQATLNADGTTTINLQGLAIPLGQSSATWLLQALVKDANGETHISGATLVTMARASAQPDCNATGVWDVYEAMTETGVDCDANLELDLCQTLPDCNGNGIADGLDIACFGAQDENNNGIPDECEVNLELFVDPMAASGGDGTFGAPYQTLASAFDAALDGSTIRLFDGTYSGPLNRNLQTQGRALRLESLGGANACTIDLQDAARLLFGQGNGSNAPFEMRGITVERAGGPHGGAVSLVEQDGLFEDCVFRNNNSVFSGGALSLTGASLTVRDCAFQDNTAQSSPPFQRPGGAIFARGEIVIERCTFDRNVADLGGALSLQAPLLGVQVPVQVTHCVFRSNEARIRGGAIHTQAVLGISQGITLWVDHGFFGFNTADAAGGVYAAQGNNLPSGVPQAVFSSCTMVENSAGTGAGSGEGGGALYLGTAASADVVGSILWGNSAGAGSQIRAVGSPSFPADVDVFASTVEGGAPGISLLNGSTANFMADSLSADPLFMNPPADYRLGAGSPCVDSMSNALLQADLGDIDGDGNDFERVPLDLLLNPRRVDDPAAPDTGSGPGPLPDMGAFERQ